MTEEESSVKTDAICVGCLHIVPLEEYLANDHMCEACNLLSIDLLEGRIPRLKD